MNGLLLVAHGSRLSSSNTEIAEVSNKMEYRLTQRHSRLYDVVQHCFLELCDPDIPTALKSMIDKGCQSITMFPYFLAAGHHVMSDLPEFLKQAQADYPDIAFQLLPHLGSSDAIVDLILSESER